MKLHNLRQQYKKGTINEVNLPDDPIIFFKEWFTEAMQFHQFEANACILSTVSANRPSSRVILLKEFSPKGFVFFTNYNSRKGMELSQNPFATLNFFWPDLERQVRVEGRVAKIEPDESDNYFLSRPMESQVSAIISPQSSIIESKQELLQIKNDFLSKGLKIQRPENWGGFCLTPDYFEFWQGGADRLHDRIIYNARNESQWLKNRLAP
jgi:pyridoxamine 5'-phosphate oxidase